MESFIKNDDTFGHLYEKKLRNAVAIPKLDTENAAGYDIVSEEETVEPCKGQSCHEDGDIHRYTRWMQWTNSPTIRSCCKGIHRCGAGGIDANFSGEIGVVSFNYSEGDFKVKHGDRIVQLISEKMKLFL